MALFSEEIVEIKCDPYKILNNTYLYRFKSFHNMDGIPIDENTTALLLERHLTILWQKSTFWGKYLITMVKFGSNLNETAPKNPGRKLERRHSIYCINMVYWGWTLNLKGGHWLMTWLLLYCYASSHQFALCEGCNVGMNNINSFYLICYPTPSLYHSARTLSYICMVGDCSETRSRKLYMVIGGHFLQREICLICDWLWVQLQHLQPDQ